MDTSVCLLTWPDYLNPLTLSQFEAEFGVAVALESVPSAAELVERMRAARPAPDGVRRRAALWQEARGLAAG